MSATMTNKQYNERLESIARAIDEQASSVEDAAAIVRKAKVEASEGGIFDQLLDFAADELAVPEVHVKKHK